VTDSTRTSGPTGTPGATEGGGRASSEGLLTEPNNPSGIIAAAFMELARKKNLAIIGTAELVLINAEGAAVEVTVREFAERMIDDHNSLNRQLNQFTKSGQFNVSDSADLIDRAANAITNTRRRLLQ
jgi:predicted outer membrane protein